MKRPTWATVVGVLGIIFGIFGILGGGQEIMAPQMIAAQKQMFTQLAEAQSNKPSNPQAANAAFLALAGRSMMKKMWNFPPWFGKWEVFSGISKAAISALYLLSAIWMLQLKKLRSGFSIGPPV